MSTPADKVIITLTGDGYTIEAYAERVNFAGQTVEMDLDGKMISKCGDDLFLALPMDLASLLHDMELNLMDAVIALMPEAA